MTYPALPVQRQLWLLQRAAPNVGVANISARFQWQGPLDLLAFQQANGDYIARHPFLQRTVETCADAGLVQVQHPPQSPVMTVHDIAHWAGEKQKLELKRLARQAAESPIDESVVPWIQLTVIRLDEQRFEIAFAFSHLICDGLSMGILCRELLEAYEARLAGRRPNWKNLVADDLAQPIAVEPTKLKNHGVDSQNRISDVELSLPWDRRPTDYPTDYPTYVGKRISFELTESESQIVNSISRQHACSPFVTWLSLIQVLCAKYSGSNRFNIDIVTAGRTKELRRMVGPFFRTVPMPLSLNPNDSLAELLTQNQLAAERLNSSDQQQPSTNTRSRILVDYQASLRTAELSNGVRVVPSEWDNGAAVAELCIGIRRQKQNYCGHFKYDVELFDPETIKRMIGHLKTLLESASTSLDAPIAQLNYMTRAERTLLNSVNQTKTVIGTQQLVDRQFVEQAARTPDAIALIVGEHSLSYSQLLDRANRIETELQAAGVVAGDRVAIQLPGCFDSVAAMLGILMRGACYVPIDANLPDQRRHLILRSADVACVVCNRAELERLPNKQVTLCVEDMDGMNCVALNPLNVGDRAPADIAYVLFTSGSTGVPKGVEVTHANLANFFVGVDALAEPAEGGTWLAVTSTAFDISGFELLWTLTRGFKVIIATGELNAGMPIGHFANCVSQFRVTHFQCTPALMQLLLNDESNRKALSRLKKIFVGGDRLPQPLADKLLQLASGDVFNMYGPTETTIWSTAWKLERNTSVRIGKPLANQQIHVLDVNLQHQPIGIYGELYIGGKGVAHGYFRNELENESRFLQHSEYGRLYRTGDIVRMLNDGNLIFHGRNDQQVKLHGHRFELGDVESALCQHSGIAQAVALLKVEAQQTSLIAFISGPDVLLPNSAELKDFLNRLLPPCMIPRTITAIREFPLNGSGKIDRLAVAEMSTNSANDSRSRGSGADFVLKNECSNANPRSPVRITGFDSESWAQQQLNQLRAMICEELQLDALPAGGRWSDLTISSLDVVGLVVRVERDLGITLEVADVFRDSLIEQTLQTAAGMGHDSQQRLGERNSASVGVSAFEEGVI